MSKVLFLVGPTAAGKTEYAIQAANSFDGEIVSADSMQIYKYFDIGSAKPTKEERSRAVHYLVDVIDPKSPFSVAEYQPLAKNAIRDISGRKKLPIVSGGTGLYVNSLLYKMDFGGAEGNSEVRLRLEKEAEEKGAAFLYDRLTKLAPEAALRIEPENTRKVIRALELIETTGSALSDFESSFVPTDDYEPVLIGLTRNREDLIERINRRVESMFEQGLVDEVYNLIRTGVSVRSQAMQAIGYKEIVDAFDGKLTDIHDEPIPAGSAEAVLRAKELIKIHTRQYAKRQMTWFKRLPGIEWINLSESDSVEDFLSLCSKRISD